MHAISAIKRRLGAFRRDESGNFALIFTIAIIPILGTAALAVDYSNIERHRSGVQNALDAATLAAAREYSKGVTGTALENYAEDFFEANLPDYIDTKDIKTKVSLKKTNSVDSQGKPTEIQTVSIDADLDYHSFIAQVVGHEKFAIDIASQVAIGNITVEVALVLDNSGSMGSNNKIYNERETAKDLVDTIFKAAANSNKPNPVSFALVSFSAMVNIGTQYKDEDWMDINGWSSIHHENLDWANTYVTNEQFGAKGAGFRERVKNGWEWRTRYDLFDMLDTPWTGCVEMRPWPHNTLDTAATNGAPASSEIKHVNENSSKDLRDRLFVPLFAPAEPYYNYAYKKGKKIKTSSDWDNYPNDYLYDWKRPKSSNTSQLEDVVSDDNLPAPYNKGFIQDKQNLRQDWVWRYQAADISSSYNYVSGDGTSKGPNYGCESRPLTPLTTSQNDIKNEIGKMQAQGMTNIQQGVSWGWRTLSPGVPFTAGRDPEDTSNRKYMIVLTDGNNTYNSSSTPNETEFGAWGYGKQGRIEEGLSNADLAGTPYVGDNLNTYEKKMNAHTVQTCNNAKADGVTVFTIAFDVRNGSSVKDMLEACSGSGIVNGNKLMTQGIFYYDVSASDLDKAMASIADQISTMRILR